MLNDEQQHADEPEDEQRVEEVALGAREGRHRDGASGGDSGGGGAVGKSRMMTRCDAMLEAVR